MSALSLEAIAQVAILAAAGASDSDIADVVGVAPRTVLRWRQAAGIPSAWTPPRPAHGRPGRYARGCRCDTCQAAHAARMAAWRAAQQSKTRRAPSWGLPWTLEDDAVLEARGVSAATALGRTYAACANRLDRLRNPL